MKYILVCVFVVFVNLQAYTLKEILELQKQDNTTKQIEANRAATMAQNALLSSYEAPRLSASVADAKEQMLEGVEYTFGISQNVSAPFAFEEKAHLQKSLSNATMQKRRHELHLRELDTAAKYYASCSAKAISEEAAALLEGHKKRVTKLSSAYRLGEISKKALLFSKLDLAKSQKDARKYERAYLEDFSLLQKNVSDYVIDTIACSDIVEPKRSFIVKNLDLHAELKRVGYERDAADSLHKLYSAPLQSIGYELSYEDELMTQRYRFGINIPLTAFTSQNTLLKEAALQKKLSYTYELDAFKNEINATATKLVQRVAALYEEYELFIEEILPLSQELLELSEYAYREGEGTLMEFLDSSRSFSQSRLEMLELKKRYYEEMFALYKITDTHLGEEICTK
jgi:hypothetical protein